MRAGAIIAIAGALLTGLAPLGASADAAAPGGCKHPLALVASSATLPPSVTQSLKSWMALRGERWNATDSRSPGELVANYLWAGRSGSNWIVGYKVGGVACCQTRLALFVPAAGGYRQVTPNFTPGGPDLFGDPTCRGVDAILTAYGAKS